jgi:FkbM family methyltransferase
MTTRPQAEGRIGLYLVGARDGLANIVLPPAFNDDQFFVYFEADESAIPQIISRNDPAISRVFPICLSDTNGPGTFYLNYDPFTSSLLEEDPELQLASWGEGRDYPFGETFRNVRVVPVETRTMDSLDVLADPAVAPPTVIALDTQGTELAILRGARELIGEHTMGIVTEAEFVPFYKDQPLFGDVCAGLSEMGFIFVDFAYGPFKLDAFGAKLGMRSKRIVSFCDALFLRKPTSVSTPLQLAQLTLVAVLYGHIGYALHCLDLLLVMDPGLESVPRERLYREFLLELDRVRKLMPIIETPTFGNMYPTYELSTERFDAAVTRDTLDDHYRDGARAIKDRLLENKDALLAILSLENSPLENLLAGYGFIDQATDVKQRRIDEAHEMCKTVGIIVERATVVVGENDPRP